MFNKEDALILLHEALGQDTKFRNQQWESINMIVNNSSRFILLQHTGWGKSYVYFISTKLLRSNGAGVTVVISPLLSLIRNQMEQAKKFNITVGTINSSNMEEWDSVIYRLRRNQIDLLLISPERLANRNFITSVMSKLCKHIGFLVVDEVHCISNWGYDFRPDYRKIKNLLGHLNTNIPVLGCTATANERVLLDTMEQLDVKEIVKGNLLRTELKIKVLKWDISSGRILWLSSFLSTVEGSGIIYTLTKKDATFVSEKLTTMGINVRKYYSGLDDEEYESREELENMLLDGSIKALVATNALGMGFDKGNIRFVINYGIPESMLVYYQQIGRAGRDGEFSWAILLPSEDKDSNVHRFLRHKAYEESGYSENVNMINIHREKEYRDMLKYIRSRSCRIGEIMYHLDTTNKYEICGICDNCNPFQEDEVSIASSIVSEMYDKLKFVGNYDKYIKVKQIENLKKGSPQNVGTKWTVEEETMLLNKYDRGISIKDISILHDRTSRGIRARLKHLGKI